MSASEIKAGSAYIEIGAKSDQLDKALKAASEKIKSFGEGMSAVGARLTILGGAMTAPLIASAKAFADYGENIGKLASKTGMSEDALSGLTYAAQSSGIAVGSVGSAVKGMQRAITSGSKEATEAFSKIGLSAETLKSLSPEEQLATIADAMAGLADPAERAAVAQAAFGRAGVEILPIIEAGSGELSRMQREAQRLGLTLGGESTRRANDLDAAFDRLAGSLKGVALHIGNAIAGGLAPLINRMTDVIVWAWQWVDANKDLVVSFAKWGVEILVAGAALTVLGMALSAAMTPAYAVTAGIVAIGMSLLAVTDNLGITATGFGQLFNAIRIQGTGLGTWMTEFSLGAQKVWNWLADSIGDAFSNLWHDLKQAVPEIENALLAIPHAILMAFSAVTEGVGSAINWIIDKFNSFLAAMGQKPISFKIDPQANLFTQAEEWMAGQRTAISDRVAKSEQEFQQGKKDTASYRKQRDRLLNQDVQRGWLADPQDATTGITVDTDRAKKALMGIGDNIWNAMGGAVEGILDKLNVPRQTWENPGERAAAGGAAWTKPEFSAVGSFSGFGGGNMAASGVFNRQLETQIKMSDTMSKIEANTRAGGGALTLT